uniref:Uncharacterized protein n=1 Tax=Panagrolaimus sp. ES5 TaxID=591445 RepID=A0AC34FYI1_9BILA
MLKLPKAPEIDDMKINGERLEYINFIQAQDLFIKDSIVVVVSDAGSDVPTSSDADDSAYYSQKTIYKRAKLLCNIPSPSPHKIWIHFFLIMGKFLQYPSIQGVYAYDFYKEVPKVLTAIISLYKLPKTPKTIDMFVFDINKMKYVFVGRKSDSFNPAPYQLDGIDTDTESVYFVSDDWENEKDSDAENDPINDEKCIFTKNKVLSVNMQNVESDYGSDFELDDDSDGESVDSS